MNKNWLQAGIAAALLVSGALVAGAAHANSTCPSACPNGRAYTAITNNIWAWGTTQTLQTPACGNCFGAMWSKFQSSGSNMVVTITTGSGFSGDCAVVSAFDRNGNGLGSLANTNDGSSVGEAVPGTPVLMGGAGGVCDYTQ